jgi:hypothetical protein
MTPKGWHGTDDELQRLRAAVEHYCTCTSGPGISANQIAVPTRCSPTNGYSIILLFVYRMKDRLDRAEWSGAPGTATRLIDRWLTS